MNIWIRRLALPLVALVLVAVVLGVQIANGGGRFEPLKPADPCDARDVSSRVDGVDALTETLVLRGMDEAACRLGVSREELTLDLAEVAAGSAEPDDAQIDALRAGLLAATRQMADEGTLPKVSELVDEILDAADLNRFVEAGIRALPDSVIDAALSTDDVLIRAITDLDLAGLLADLDDADELQQHLTPALTDAVKDALIDRLPQVLRTKVP